MKSLDFFKEIGSAEFKSIVGLGGYKLLVLVSILTLSLLAMGIATGSKEYLAKLIAT